MNKTAPPKASHFPKPKGAVVHEKLHKGYRLQIVISDDEMKAYVSIRPIKKQRDLIQHELLEQLLNQHGITAGLDIHAIKLFCEHACRGKDQNNVVLARTMPPKPGPDGWIEPLIRTAQDTDTDFREDEHGRLDLYTLNLFTTVEPEQKIAILHEPKIGEASSTVTGKILSPIMGNELQIRLGQGVRVEDNGTSFISEISGRADLSDNVISVSEDYMVHGDVDLEVGNINFPGFSQIRGDVLDSFDIHSQKGIVISGTVGNSHLISDGDVTIGSMSGRDEGLIRCGGNLKANYLNAVTVECMGTVTVTNEIRNCVIKAADKIIVASGIISGGSCIALNGIEARDIGAEAGVITKMTAGIYFPEEDCLQNLKMQQRSISHQNKFIQRCLGPLQQQVQRKKSLSPAVKKRLEILLERLELLKELKKDVQQQLKSFVHEEHDGNSKINVHRRLREKVIITLDNITEEIRQEQDGPLSVIADNTNNRLRFCELSSLDINAAAMPADEELDDAPEEIKSAEGEKVPANDTVEDVTV